MPSENMNHMNHLEAVAAADVAHLQEKEKTYQGSWKKRGGVGAWMMACRKFDRLEGILSQDTPVEKGGYNWDVFAAIKADPSGIDGCALAEIRDLRRYLLLVEAEMVSRGVVHLPVPDVYAKLAAEIGTTRTVAKHAALSASFGEDSNRHAKQEYLMDGMKAADYPTEVYCITTRAGVAIVDRARTAPEKWEHLPRLALELNHQEWKETPPEYQWMYLYEEAAGKYILGSRWREHWGRQT